MSLLTQCNDILQQIIPYCGTLLNLSNLSQTNRLLSRTIMHSNHGRSAWLKIASSITGFKANELIEVSSYDFHCKLKLLISPWLSIPCELPLKVQPLMDTDKMRITANNNNVVLWLKTENGYQIVDSANAHPDTGPYEKNLHNLKPPRKPSKKTFWQIMPPSVLQILPHQEEYRYFYQNIHASAYAIIEVTSWDVEQRNGIHIFSKNKGKKELRHILLGECPSKTSMIIRPMEMWMLTEERVIYFGPSCEPVPLTKAGRIGKALWLAGTGRVKEAIGFMRKLGVSDINAQSTTGNMTVLLAATCKKRTNAVRALLKAKADPEARDDQEMTCLMVAAAMECPALIRILCFQGKANPNVETSFNESALHLVGTQSTEPGKCITLAVEALLDCMADPNTQDLKGRTPLYCFAILDSTPTVDVLCSRGANPMHRDLVGSTPLHALFQAGHKRETAILLVKKFKVDVNAQDKNGMTALMHAANTRVYANVLVLLDDLQANPLLVNKDGDDALALAKGGEEAPGYARGVIRMLESKCKEWKDAQR